MSKNNKNSDKPEEYWRSEVAKIREDTVHGSLYLADNALKIAEKFIQKQFYNNRTELYQSFSKLVNSLVRSQPLMALIYTRMHRILDFIESLPKDQRNIIAIKNLALEEVQKIREESQEAYKAIIKFGSRLILDQHVVLTHSASELVESILLEAKRQKKHFRLICLESRPQYEGKQLAIKMAKAGIKTRLVPDADITRVIKEAHFALTGVDRITEISFVNKTGTHCIAVLAKEFNIPFYIAVDTAKILPKRTYPARYSSQNEKEILEKNITNLTAENYYFEEIPISYVHKIICETGIFEVEEFEERYLKF